MNYKLQAQRYIQKRSLDLSPLRSRLDRGRAQAVADVWSPLPGPQLAAIESEADIVGFGGQAGGGKTDLLIGCSLGHRRSMIFRREYTQLEAIIERSRELLTGKGRFNETKHRWSLPDRTLRLGACQRPGDEFRFQGWERSFVGIDEAAHFTERQVLTLMAWLRTADPGERTRAVLVFNPPTTVDGLWLLRWFAPWIDPDHASPARPGEIRWFARIGDRDTEVPGPEPVLDGAKWVQPKSRTFIPASLADNPYLAGTGYERELDQLPEPLRSQMRYGDFQAGLTDDAWQLIPSAWLKAAMARWRPEGPTQGLATLGVDVARGGSDRTAIARRREWHVWPIEVYPGSETDDGGKAAALVDLAAAPMDGAQPPTVNVDVIGVGSSAYDALKSIRRNVHPINVASGSRFRDRSGRLGMSNVRAEMYWRLREALDPSYGAKLAIPPDEELREELLAHRWTVTASGVQIEAKEEIEKRIGRSPDRADAVALSILEPALMVADEKSFAEHWSPRRGDEPEPDEA